MFSIKNVENMIVINKSKFITNLICVDNKEEVLNALSDIKNKYKDATHHCYAYIIDNTKRFSDDNEPNGTAGMPILECLEKNNLNHVLCVVTRYFGGTKLGAGNLLRAYSNSVSIALNKTDKVRLINGYKIKLEFDYNNIRDIEKLIKDYEVIDKIFDKTIIYYVLVDEKFLNNLNIPYEIMSKEIIKTVFNKTND